MSALFVVVGAFVSAVLITFLAINIAGGGDGWNCAIISGAGLVLLPIAAVAVIRQQRRTKLPVSVAAILADVALAVATSREGFHYVHRVFAVGPGPVFAWVVPWHG